MSASQEDRLRRCPFARESDEFSGHEDEEDPTPAGGVDMMPTGILIVSPPDSSEANDDSTPDDVFQTPPEGSVFPSSEEQGSMVVDRPNDPEADAPRDAEAHDDPVAVDGGRTDCTQTVNLGVDLDLGFSEVELTQRIDDDWEAYSSRGDVSELEWHKLELLRRELLFKIESPSKKSKIGEPNFDAPDAFVGAVTDQNTENFQQSDLKVDCKSHENLEINQATAVEEYCDDANVPEEASVKRELELPKRDSGTFRSESEESREDDNKMFQSESDERSEDSWEEAGEGEGNGCGCSHGQPIETNGRLQYVRPCKLGETVNAKERYCTLPLAEKRAERLGNGDNGKKVSILDVLKILREGCADRDDTLKDVSIFDICKQRGVFFSRPSWWREEGYKEVEGKEDDGYDGQQEKGEE